MQQPYNIYNINLQIVRIQQIQMKSIVTLKSARNLPKLGLSTNPSPYVIIQTGENQDVTPISQNTCNPNWNYEIQINAEKLLEKVVFYVYNSNTNYEDELIALGDAYLQDFMTPVLTNSVIMLKDSKGNCLNSWLEVQHHDWNPPAHQGVVLNQRTTIRINLLSITGYQQRSLQWISKFPKKNLSVLYGSQVKDLDDNISTTALVYDKTQSQIKLVLQLNQRIILNGTLLVDNIRGNSAIRVKMHYGYYEVVVLMGASMIQNGLLQQKYNKLTVQIGNVIIEPIKNVPKDWTIVVYSVFGKQTIKKTNQPYSMYVQNNTYLQFQYFEQNADLSNIKNFQPLASYLLPINSVDWSNNFQSKENIKMFNPARGIVINVDIRLTVQKIKDKSDLIPKFEKPTIFTDSPKGIFKLSQIKMSGACFYQIFTEKTLFNFVYITNSGQKIVFQPFEIKNSSQYSIQCRQNIPQSSTGGTLYLITFDHYFGVQNSNQSLFQNYIIFKINCKNIQQITEGQVIFHERFLAFAKKQTLVKPCKKFDSMVKDKLLSIKLVMRRFAYFQPGLLTIRNCMVEGFKNKIQLAFIFDSNQIRLSGQSGRYLLTKPYTVKVKDNGIQFKYTQLQAKKQIHYQMQQIFGAMDEKLTYLSVISLGQGKTLKLFYEYEIKKQPQQKPKQQIISRFSAQTPLLLKIKNAWLPSNSKSQSEKTFCLRVTKGQSTYETIEESSTNSFIRFRDCEEMEFGKESANQYIFFNLYGKQLSNDGNQGGLVIFAGYYQVKNLIGKGVYQITLTRMGSQQKKQASIISFELLNNIPLMHSGLKILLKQISMLQQYMKSILKYYLVAQINNNPIHIFQLSKSNDTLIANPNETIYVKNSQNVIWRLYSSSKQLSKEAFWTSDKELVASGKLMWTDVENNGSFKMRFLPTKDLNTKLSGNRLALLQNTVNIVAEYAIQPQNTVEIVLTNKISKRMDVEVLHSAAAKITILQIIPIFSFQNEKILEMKLLPFEFDIGAQSRFSLNKQFIIDLTNMKANFAVVKNSKLRQKYQRTKQQKVISFRGKKVKTMEKIGFFAYFPGVCLIKANAVIYSNKFTNNPHGTFKILSIGTQSSKIKQIEIYGLKNANQTRKGIQKLSSIKVQMPNNKKVDIKNIFETSEMTFCLYFIITFEDKLKVKSLLQIAQLYIDKLQIKPFRHQWTVQHKDKSTTVMWIQAEYNYNMAKGQQVEGEVANYSVQKQNQLQAISIQYKNKQKVAQLQQSYKASNYRPNRKRGFRVVLNLPQHLHAKQVFIILHDNSKVKLRKAEHNQKSYIYNSEQQIKVKTIEIDSAQIQRIQQLQQKNFTRRFLINRTPSLLVYLLCEPYAMTDDKPQSIVLKFQFHKLYSASNSKKIMWVKSNKNDQILTKTFGILLKHGNQKALIRPIDESGEMLKQGQANAFFGFDPLSDQIQVYLYIHHVLNENQIANSLSCEDLQNWTKLFPVAYGKISLQKIAKNSLVGCSLKRIQNFNQTLDKPLNNIFEIVPDLSCLGLISMQKNRWGLISIKLQQISGFQFDFPTQNMLIYLTIQVENSQRNKMAGITTEARNFQKVERLQFIINKFKFFYMEQKGESQSLKITANLMSLNDNIKIFEKRADVSEILREPGVHPLSTQIKPNEAKGLKSLVQLKFKIKNQKQQSGQMSTIQKARSINKVDILSFQQLKQNQILKRLLQCQQKTHFWQVLNEIKESVIYSKQSQFDLFRMCNYYLQFQNDPKVVSILLQMINIEMFKFPNAVSQLSQQDISKIYEYTKQIFFSRPREVPKLQKKISTSDYNQFLQSVNLSNSKQLDESIKFQKKKLYNSQQLMMSASLIHGQQILPVIEAFVQKSQKFKSIFKAQIKEWNEVILHKQDKIFSNYLSIVQSAYQNQQIPSEIICDIFQKAIKKQLQIQSLVNLWSKLPKQKMQQHLSQLFNKIVSKFGDSKQSQQSVQSFRSLMNCMQMNKIEATPENWKYAVQTCTSLIVGTKEFISLNLYSELLTKINSMGIISENEKIQIIGSFKKRISTENDKNIKLVISGLIDKLTGKKVVGNQEQNGNQKRHFYKKYLITS